MSWASFADDGASAPKAAAARRIVISLCMKSLPSPEAFRIRMG
jgi:hypothetical protein